MGDRRRLPRPLVDIANAAVSYSLTDAAIGHETITGMAARRGLDAGRGPRVRGPAPAATGQ